MITASELPDAGVLKSEQTPTNPHSAPPWPLTDAGDYRDRHRQGLLRASIGAEVLCRTRRQRGTTPQQCAVLTCVAKWTTSNHYGPHPWNRLRKKLYPWFSISEAATEISHSLSESFSDADILRLALDAHLKLSAYFPAPAHFRKLLEIEAHTPEALIWCLDTAEGYLRFGEKIGATVINDPKTIEDRDRRTAGALWQPGLYDFPLVSSQRNLVLKRWHELIGEPIQEISCDSICVVQANNVYQLQAGGYGEFFLSGDSRNPARDLEPAGRLVVSTDEVKRFVRVTKSPGQGQDMADADDPRRVKTLLRIVHALSVMTNLPDEGAATAVVAQLELMGHSKPGLSAVRKALALARDPEAL